MNLKKFCMSTFLSILTTSSLIAYAHADDLEYKDDEQLMQEDVSDIEPGGMINVQGVGKYSTQEGADANSNGSAQVLWDVQWSTSHGPGGDRYIYMLNETDIFVPKAVENIHLTLGQAVSSYFETEDVQKDDVISSQEVEKARIRNDVRTMIELKKDTGDIDFNSFYQDDNGKWKRIFAGEDTPENYTKENMLDVGSVAYVQEDLKSLPKGTILPEGINDENLKDYKMIRIASDKKGMHTVRVSGTINVSGAKSDVYVPLRATNKIHRVGFDRMIINNLEEYYQTEDAHLSGAEDIISMGELPEFSINNKKVNKNNADIYNHEANQLAGFYTTDQCKVTLNTYDENGDSVTNSAGLQKIEKDIYDINDIERGKEKEDGCDQSALRINTDNIRRMSLWEKILNLFR